MKILINTSNLVGGGGLQVALSFINELKYINNDNEYHIFLSNAVNSQIDQEKFPDCFKFYFVEKSPAQLRSRKKILEKLDYLEGQIKPDVVFSVFGPSYWRPKAIHLLGVADGWIYNSDSIAYSRLSFFEQIKRKILGKYKSYYLKKDADYFVLETNDAKIKLARTIHVNINKVFVVGNTHSSVFLNDEYMTRNNSFYKKLPDDIEKVFKLLYITSYKANKNLEIIEETLPLLKGYNIKFILTLDEDIFKKIYPDLREEIVNIGPISHNSCPSVYAQSDALFAPTLLETFSASYPEAMKMEKPILTSNYSFATDVCQDAALYFDPLDPEDIADKIKKLIDDKALQKDLIKKGKKRVEAFETARSRAEKYLNICEQIAKL